MASAPDPQRRLAGLLRRPAGRALAAAAGAVPCHLVGGALRDCLLERPVRDLDAVVEHDGEAIAGRLAATLGARAIRLGGDRFAAWRVTRGELTIDLWDREGQSLASDLERRDLTIHAIAIGLADGEVSDPFDGLGDLARRRLRAVTLGTFAADPLRVLRLARFAAELPGFTVEPSTLDAARSAAPALAQVAPERIRDELRRSLTLPDPLPAVALWVELALATPAASSAGLARLGRLEPWLAGIDAAERLAARWAALLLEAGAGGAANLRESGWLSRRDAGAVGTLLALRPKPADEPERRRFLHAAGRRWRPAAAIAVLAAGGDDGTFGHLEAALAKTAHAGGDALFDPPVLLDGQEVARLAALAPGPELGSVIAALRAAQVEGRVVSREDAERFVVGLKRCS